MKAIVVDPVGNRLYFTTDYGGVQVINMDGSSRTELFYDVASGLAVDLKAG